MNTLIQASGNYLGKDTVSAKQTRRHLTGAAAGGGGGSRDVRAAALSIPGSRCMEYDVKGAPDVIPLRGPGGCGVLSNHFFGEDRPQVVGDDIVMS